MFQCMPKCKSEIGIITRMIVDLNMKFQGSLQKVAVRSDLNLLVGSMMHWLVTFQLFSQNCCWPKIILIHKAIKFAHCQDHIQGILSGQPLSLIQAGPKIMRQIASRSVLVMLIRQDRQKTQLSKSFKLLVIFQVMRQSFVKLHINSVSIYNSKTKAV